MKKIVITTALFTLFLFVTGAYAKTVYTVKKGDNLHDIARKYHVTTRDIESINRVNAKNLKPGTKITIPAAKKSSKTAKKGSRKEKTAVLHAEAPKNDAKGPSKHEQTERENIQPVKTAADSSKYHVVRKGDSLRTIARKYNASVSDIKKLNALPSAKLKVGQKLLVKLSPFLTV